MENIKECLIEFINNPHNDIINFNLASVYEEEKQYASAFSYYLRCAEFTDNNILASESLVRCSLCINRQGGRDQKELYLLKHAITASPNSLEPYYIASLYYSWRSGSIPEKRFWLDSYMYASLGINLIENNLQSTEQFIIPIGFEVHELYYQKAYAGMNIGKINEAREILIKILQKYELSYSTKNFIIMKLNELPEPNHPIIPYSKNNINKLKLLFNNSEKIDNNFSQIYQDMYVLSMHNGKMNGTYLEIGAGDYKYGNNTYLLEGEFNWTGVSIDFNQNLVNNFNQNRNNNCICSDATTIDYLELLKNNYKSTNIDYLQLDCDPPNITFNILSKIPFDQYKFGVITYEHDFYNDITGSYREKAREFLKEKGYKLIAGNISPYGDKCPFEDWWIHPEVIDENIWKLFERDEDTPINGEEYMLTKNEIIDKLYDYIPCHDQKGNDIVRVNKENIQMSLVNASNDPSIIAINTEGYVKNHIEKLEQINGWGWNVKTNESAGIYIKKSRDDTLIKCSKSSIPVLGVLVCTTTKWIEKQIQSIDFPIENYIIINNNENFLAEKLDILVSKGNKFIKNLKVYHMPYNLGCAEGWNTIIKSFLFSPYWVIVNDDVSFTPGFLKELHETALENQDAGLIHGNPCKENFLTKFGSFDMFLIRDWVIKDFGLFDTNFYPAYQEDYDYIFRLRNSSVKIINQLNHKYYHGDTFDYYKSGQNTKKFSNKLSNKLIDIRYKNYNYFYKKWNICPEWIDENSVNDIYKYPFNNPANKLSMISYDIEFARDKSLHNVLPSCDIKKTNTFEVKLASDISLPHQNIIVIDDFYDDPDKIREYALSLNYQPPENHGAVGYRCEYGRKILDGTKELFEKLLDATIPDGNNHGEWNYSTNGCFQWCNAKTPIVYHCDSQKYAAIIYLTPNAPPNCGTSFFRHKKYKIRNSEIFSKSDWYQSDLNYKEPHLDKTQWEAVDNIGNVYNRLVIFDAQYIHAVTEYFGEDINNSRLFQLFFFNINQTQ